MQGTNRTIVRFIRVFLAAALIAALAPAAAGAAAKPAPVIKGAWHEIFPEEIHGNSVAVGPDGSPWFGITPLKSGFFFGRLQSGKLAVETVRESKKAESSVSLQFDSSGALWFAQDVVEGPTAIDRRDPSGKVSEFPLPGGEPVAALTIGPEGDIWFVRGGYGKKSKAAVGWMTPTGAVTQFPLAAGSRPVSITPGPDGAFWFSEESAGKIGRVTTSGEVRLFPLAPKAQPRQIVAGPDGALWFGMNGKARPYGRISDRIGRITTSGQVSELPIPFGEGTTTLVPDPGAGVVWFATEAGEFSSIAPSGNVGARGCVVRCENPIEGMALGPDGTLWFAAGHAFCVSCGGGSDLIIENEGTEVGSIPAGALTPADPAGPPAEDPYAKPPAKPPPPIARTGKPWTIESDAAGVTGYINSRGYPTTWRYRWGRTKHYGHFGFYPEDPFGAEQGAAHIEELFIDLCPSTTYHYELIAYGPGGRAYGGDRTFRTKPAKYRPKHCR
jgi:virginiamycin B lyase